MSSTTKVVRVIHDPRDSSKDEYLTAVSARTLYNLGMIELDETNSKPGEAIYTAVHDADKHPQWEAWKRWHTKHHGAYIPMALGQPSTFPTLVSWQSWCAAWVATKPKWRAFADEKPPVGPEQDAMVEILWRSKPIDGTEYEVGIGWYALEDAAQWEGEWMLVNELQ